MMAKAVIVTNHDKVKSVICYMYMTVIFFK